MASPVVLAYSYPPLFAEGSHPLRDALPVFRRLLRPGEHGYEEQEEHRHWRGILEGALDRLCTCRTCSCPWCSGHIAGCLIHDLDFDDDE
jgi:hypothetical protein